VLQRVIGNSGWMLVDRVVRLGVGLVVSVWLARYLGAGQFGQWNFGLALVGLFATLANLGIDAIVVRDLVKAPAQAPQILGTASALKLGGAVATVVSTTFLIAILRSGDWSMFWVVFLVSAGFLFQSLDVIDLWFQSDMRVKQVVLARNAAFLAIAVVKIGLILLGAPLVAFAAAALAEGGLVAVGLYAVYRFDRKSIAAWHFDIKVATGLVRDGWPLMLSGVVVLVYMRIDQIMLSQMLGDVAVGVYSAAVKVSEVWYFIPTVLVSVVAPVLVRAKSQGDDLYHRRVVQLLRTTAILSLGLALLTFVIAQPLIDILFGPTYEAAGDVLKVHVWALLFVALGAVSGQYLVIEGLSGVSLQRTAIGAFANVILNIYWIPAYGAIGAAWATFFSYGIATFWLVQGPRSFRCMKLMARALLPIRQ